MPELAKGSPWNTSHTRRQFAIGAVSLPVALSAPMALAAQGGRHTPLRGINLAGAEFGDPPGVHGRHYQYPGTKHINYYRSLGFNTIRLPFMWERIQPALNQPFAPREERLLTGIVEYATKAGMHVVIDPHNFGKRRLHTDDWKVKHTVGSPQVPATSFADLWTRLAMLFGGNDKVVFGLMNEPHDVPSSDWLPVADAAVQAIRRARASNLILIPGVAYSGAHSWLSAKNDVLLGIDDPARNVAFEVHQYLDKDSSGTSPEAVSATIGSERIRAFQDWARANRVKGFLGEFAAAENETGSLALRDLLRTMAENGDIWLGWTAWAGGPWWPADYIFNLEPVAGRMRTQTQILSEFARQA